MKYRFSQRGASAVEFALILPLLIVLTFGIIEFGLLMYNQQVLTNAAREGARYGIVQTDPTDAAVTNGTDWYQGCGSVLYADYPPVTLGAANFYTAPLINIPAISALPLPTT